MYIGYPVNLEEAIRLFRIEYTELPETDPNYRWRCVQFVNRELTTKYNINFCVLDKGLYVIGYHVNESMDSCCKSHTHKRSARFYWDYF